MAKYKNPTMFDSVEKEYYTIPELAALCGLEYFQMERLVTLQKLASKNHPGKRKRVHKSKLDHVRYIVALQSMTKPELLERLLQVDDEMDKIQDRNNSLRITVNNLRIKITKMEKWLVKYGQDPGLAALEAAESNDLPKVLKAELA